MNRYQGKDKPNVSWVDQQLGRKPGEPLGGGEATNFLLKLGFHAHIIIDFDNQRFINEGLSYLRKWAGNNWNKEYDLFWTPEMVAERQRLTISDMKFRQQFASRLTIKKGIPTIEDIRKQLQANRLVDTTFGREVVAHAVLVFDRSLDKKGHEFFHTYSPDMKGPTIAMQTTKAFQKEWDPRAGIAAYWLP